MFVRVAATQQFTTQGIFGEKEMIARLEDATGSLPGQVYVIKFR